MMNLDEIAKRIREPHICSSGDIEQLHQLSNKYPFSQTFSILYLKALSINNDVRFDDELLKHAYRITDRIRLFELINEKKTNDQTILQKGEPEETKLLESQMNTTLGVERMEMEAPSPAVMAADTFETPDEEWKTTDLFEHESTEHEMDALTVLPRGEEIENVTVPATTPDQATASTNEQSLSSDTIEKELQASLAITPEENTRPADNHTPPQKEKTNEFQGEDIESYPPENKESIESQNRLKKEGITSEMDQNSKVLSGPHLMETPDAEVEALEIEERIEVDEEVPTDELEQEEENKTEILRKEGEVSPTIETAHPEDRAVTARIDEENNPVSLDTRENISQDLGELDLEVISNVLANNYLIENDAPEKIATLDEPSIEEKTETGELVFEPLATDPEGNESENSTSTNQYSNKKAFSSWLKSNVNGAPKEVESKNKIDQLVNQFLQGEPSISRPLKIETEEEKPKAEFFSPVKKARLSLDENSLPVSETLAKIFISQGNYPKAIYAYEQLMVLNPEKKIFFAQKIEELTKKINT
jgi:hypothetical protein